MSMSRNFLLPQQLRKVEVSSTSCNGNCTNKFISGHITQSNDSCNLCRNGATKLRDKLREKLSSVTAPLLSLRHVFFLTSSVFLDSSKNDVFKFFISPKEVSNGSIDKFGLCIEVAKGCMTNLSSSASLSTQTKFLQTLARVVVTSDFVANCLSTCSLTVASMFTHASLPRFANF